MTIKEVKFADIGEGVHEGEILEWHVKVGDHVDEEQLLVEVNTEKVNAEITSPVSGTVVSIEKKEGEIVKVGETLVKIEVSETAADISKSYEPTTAPTTATEQGMEEKDDSLFTAAVPIRTVKRREARQEKTMTRVLAAPAVRRRAREAGVDLTQVPGTGPGGRITQADLDRFLSSTQEPQIITKAPSIPRGQVIGNIERIPLRGIRRTIAQTMRKSKDTAAHYTYFEEVDMSALDDLRQKAKAMAEERGVKLTYLALIIKCLIPALKKFPLLNASVDDEKQEIIIKHYYNIGFAVDTPQGLVVPVIKNADKKNVWQLAKEIRELATKAREGKLTLNDVTDGTFTVTSIGNIGGVMATPIIRWPEVAILGIMKTKLRPVVIEKYGKPEIAIRPMMYLSLTLDHRIIDGAVGARFMNTLIYYMENPGVFLLEEE